MRSSNRATKHRTRSELRPDSGPRPRKKDKRRRVENQKEKFRKSREWKDFRSHMAVVFGHRDYITGRRLVKGYNLHHLRTQQDADSYQDTTNESEFMPLNSQCHKLLHYIYTYYQKDPSVIDRLVEVLDRMVSLQTLADEVEGFDEVEENGVEEPGPEPTTDSPWDEWNEGEGEDESNSLNPESTPEPQATAV